MTDLGGRSRYEDDVSDGRFKAAEELARVAFLAIGNEVVDCRGQRGSFDFIVRTKRGEYRADVKNDLKYEDTNNLIFEERHDLSDGTSINGWGVADMDWLVIVGKSLDFATVIDVPLFRALVEDNAHQARELGWKTFGRDNDADWFGGVAGPYTTRGYVVPERDVISGKALVMRLCLSRYRKDSTWLG